MVINEQRRTVPAINLDARSNIRIGLRCLRTLNRNNAIQPNLVVGVRDKLAQRLVVVGRDGGHVKKTLASNLTRTLAEFLDDLVNLLSDEAYNLVRVDRASHMLYPSTDQSLSENNGRGGSITSNRSCFVCSLLYHTYSYVLHRVV